MLLISLGNASHAGPWNTGKELFTPKQADQFSTKDDNNTYQSKSKQYNAIKIDFFFLLQMLQTFHINICCLNKRKITLRLCFVYIRSFFAMHFWTGHVHGGVHVRDSQSSSFSVAASCWNEWRQSCSLKVKINTHTHASKGNADMVVQSSAGWRGLQLIGSRE